MCSASKMFAQTVDDAVVSLPYNNKIYSFYKLNVNMEITEKVLFILDGIEEWKNVLY
jgi:hypothetical protein